MKLKSLHLIKLPLFTKVTCFQQSPGQQKMINIQINTSGAQLLYASNQVMKVAREEKYAEIRTDASLQTTWEKIHNVCGKREFR